VIIKAICYVQIIPLDHPLSHKRCVQLSISPLRKIGLMRKSPVWYAWNHPTKTSKAHPFENGAGSA